jgi:N-acyl-D-aspartate/D-glutamate deacylase
VTTTIFGNCGVGFAPIKPGQEPWLINLMQGVEDIPGSVLAEGIAWREPGMATAGTWETFPEYISVLEETPRIMDIGCQIPHGSLRFYVMGDRGADHEEVPTEEECAQMKALTTEALNAGALGFTTARTVKHMAADGRVTPGYSAHDRELSSIAEGMREANAGVIETNLTDPTAREDLAIMRRMAEVAERPLTVLLLQIGGAPDLWRLLQQDIHEMNEDGMIVTGQVGCRPVGILMGWELSMNPFNYHPTYIALKHLPVAERIARLQNEPELRAQLLSEHKWDPHAAWRPTAGTPVPQEGETVQQAYFALMDFALTRITELKSSSTGQPEYEPDLTKESLAARATASASGDQPPDPYAIALEVLLKGDGMGHLLYPHENYAGGDLSVIKELLEDPYTISGLGDAGAHVG